MADEPAKPTKDPKDPKLAASELAAMKAEAGNAKGDKQAREVHLRDQSFGVHDELPGITLLDMGLAANPNATQWERLGAAREVLDVAIVAADRGRFKELLKYADPVIGMEELDGLISQLIEQFTGRPT